MSVRIPIYNKNGRVRAWSLVDDEDAAAVRKWRWQLGTKGYAIRSGHADGRKTTVRLARFLVGLETGDPRQVDHINGNKLDNRRSNLCVVTGAQNSQNRRSYRGSFSRFRGVYRTPYGRWMAQSRFNGKLHYHGTFDTEEEAAMAASAWRAQHMPYSVEASA